MARKSPAQLDREIAEALANPAVKCPSPEHPLYAELRHIRQVAHDTSWSAAQLAKDAEDAFRNGDCAKAAMMLEAAKRVIAKERRKRPRATARGAFATMKTARATGDHATKSSGASGNGWTTEHKPSGVTVIERHAFGSKLTVVPVNWSDPSGPANWSVTRGSSQQVGFDHKRGHAATAKGAKVAAMQVAKDLPRRGAGVKRSHATRDTRYVVTVPPTREMGSYKTRVRGPMPNARRDALWDYNSARDHDALPPVDRMPSGTKYTKEA